MQWYIAKWPLGSMTLPFRVTHRLGMPVWAGKQAGGAQNITFLFISMLARFHAENDHLMHKYIFVLRKNCSPSCALASHTIYHIV